ncbi:hypothetical protein acsn021_00890 [Anaerocolumna cellulosilytica]|uniref:Uncharacterized protein n=1 Tax=Anaerocolumna cellulosilytica TaxID=433286 RepID=A0A6S6QZJ1_9FIRM|nr:hypothetical protein [Anaerocolumna cellulosilytica]BCJ92520.1 hypothetical protein acsn021_00890 [Anaerocolumna cellulosilytica]
MAFYYYLSLISVIILYVNTVTLIKKLLKDQDITTNTVIGCVCSAAVVASILAICGN